VLNYANKDRDTAQIVTLNLMYLSQFNCYVNGLATAAGAAGAPVMVTSNVPR
jgi:hypothetical protein